MDMSVRGHARTACLSILPSNVADAQMWFFFFPYMALLLWYAAGVLYVVTEY